MEAIASPAQTFTTLANFDGTDGLGAYPPVQGIDGNLYGATSGALSTNYAVVYKLTPAGALTTVYTFCSLPDCADGRAALTSLVLGTDGNFYGTTGYGGTSGGGTVFKITPTGTLTTLYSFCSQPGCADGELPAAAPALVQGTDGNFYGPTTQGGAYGSGTLFKITPTGTLTTLHSFNGTDGADPIGGLIQATDGNFYGTTYQGGTYGSGTVFQITPGGTLTTLHTFCSQTGCPDGSFPHSGLIQATDGNFYGTTAAGGDSNYCANSGCGTVFKITPGGTLTTLHIFDGTDGQKPEDPPVQATDGNLYGATTLNGTIFRITTGGAFTIMHSFDGTQGNPIGLVQATNGILYGTTSSDSGAGIAFSLSVGLGPFVETLPTSAGVGAAVIILGNNLTGATNVTFNGIAVTFTVASDTEILTTVPSGAATGTVQVTTPGGTLSSNLPFRVTGQQAVPIGSVNPTRLTFSSQDVGTTSASQPVILSNTGNAPLTITSLAASGNFGETNNCGSSVAPNNPCTINVTFSPTATGPLIGSLTITDNNNGLTGSTQTVSLSGTGAAPLAGVSPPSLRFGAQNLGTTSASQPVTLSNTGTAPLTIASIGTSANFGESNNCLSSIAPNGSCTINVNFSPTATGDITGTLTITDNNNGVAGSMQAVSLTGPGADFSMWAWPSTRTVTAGKSRKYTLSVAPISGFTGTVALGCAGELPEGSCTVSPTSVSLNGTIGASATVTAETTGKGKKGTPKGTYTLTP